MIADRWGVTADEIEAHYPCDDYVSSRRLEAWRAVTIDAPPTIVWLWLVQVRLAPYSYDWIDNGGRRSPQEPRSLPDPEVGDLVMARRQLLNFKRLAERGGDTRTDSAGEILS